MLRFKRALGIDVPGGYANLTKVCLVGLVVLLILAVGALALGASLITILCGLALGLFLEAIILPISVWLARADADRLHRMLAGDYWAHWQYTPEERLQFAEHEADRTASDMKGSSAVAGVFGIVMGAIFGVVTHSFIIFLITTGVMALIGGVIALRSKAQAKSWVYPGGSSSPEVYIGRAGVYQPGRFTSFMFLTDVKYEAADPAVILFYIVSSSNHTHYPTQLTGHTTYNTSPVRVGVPRGHESEAQQLVERFKTDLLTAK